MVSALVGHLVGDYIVQNDLLALNKKSSTFYCEIHCAIWTVCVALFAWWPLWTVVPLFIAHFIQDRTQVIPRWMDAIGQKQVRTGACAPWAAIVVDNCWHILTIWIVWQFV